MASLLMMVPLPRLHAEADAAAPSAMELVQDIVATAGGEEKLLKLFRFRERILITSTPAEKIAKDEKGNRTSVVQVGGDWWINAEKRDKDKVRVLCWAWSLRILLDAKSKVEVVPDSVVAGAPAFGLRVSESIKEPIELFFDKKTKRLVAIDEASMRHVFTEWKETSEGHKYPSHVAGFRFADRAARKLNAKQWYQTDILELTPLKELPAELKK